MRSAIIVICFCPQVVAQRKLCCHIAIVIRYYDMQLICIYYTYVKNIFLLFSYIYTHICIYIYTPVILYAFL